MATSFGTRKALGRRYAQDPALLLEAERLQQEYGLIPGREARAMQASQYQQSLAQQQAALAQQQSQFDTQQSNAQQAGMWGTAANLGTTAAMLRGYTMPKGGSFFGGLFGGTPDKMVGAGAMPTGMTIPNATAGYLPSSSYASSLPGGYEGVMGYSPYQVNPALMPEASAPVAGFSQAAEGAGAAAETAGMGLGTIAAGYGATALAGRGMESVAPEGTAVHRSGEFLRGVTDWPVKLVTDPGTAVKEAQQFVTDYVTKPVESVIQSISHFFGW